MDEGQNHVEPDWSLREPDTMVESDLRHDILLCFGKMKKSGILNALRKREISCCGAARKDVFTPCIKRTICPPQIPSKVVSSTVELEEERVFCGIFSEGGRYFLSANQDGNLSVYNEDVLGSTSKICQPFKRISPINVGWGILDVAFSPDAKYLAYSSWSSVLHIASIEEDGDIKKVDLRPGDTSFAPFSIRFLSNTEILSGATGGHLYICDGNTGERTFRINAHESDVNAVCYADKCSNILLSGGDDGIIKAWDRRLLSESNPQPVGGKFAGHIYGITFIDTKGDGRYFLSNSKDQTIKVWDMRKPSGSEAQKAVRSFTSAASGLQWDYREEPVPMRLQSGKKTVSGDTSIKTYHGHVVRRTLSRARFSPMHSTGQKYIYCGSAEGNVVVYDVITGDIVSNETRHQDCVRDVSWHPYDPTLVSSSWDSSFKVWGP